MNADRLRRRRARQPRVQLRHPAAAHVRVAAATSRCSAPTRSTRRPSAPVFPPYVIKTRPDRRTARAVKVGILGLTNPGIAIWDKANVEGKMEFPGLVEQAKKFVPELKATGCDVVVVSAHSGADTSSSYGDALPYPENAATLVAEQVPGIDAILVGHAHVEIPQRFVTNTGHGQDGRALRAAALGQAAGRHRPRPASGTAAAGRVDDDRPPRC